MNKEQAIDLLDNLIGMIEDNQDNDYDTAFRMAIDALKAQLSQEGTTSDLISRQQALNALMDAVKSVGILDADDIKAVFDMLPTIQPIATDICVGDTISRQALCEYALNQKDKSVSPNDIMRFPSAQPEPKESHWIEGKIYRDVIECNCSECGQLMTTAASVRMSFCPNCGARMTR